MILYVIINNPKKEHVANAIQYHSCTISLLFSFNVFGLTVNFLSLSGFVNLAYSLCFLIFLFSHSQIKYGAIKCEHPYRILTDDIH